MCEVKTTNYPQNMETERTVNLLVYLSTGPGAVPRPRFDPVSQGFTQPDIRYEWNKLYVLGLHYRTSPDSVKNYIKIVSGYDVSHVEWFKPNGKAIVTLKTNKIKGKYDS